jgi:tRNA threonylcarbamoyl adenosine modification protein YeaZ
MSSPPTSPLLLCLDGSTGVCSVALVSPLLDNRGQMRSWAVPASRHEGDGRAQAKVLLRLVDEMLHEVDAEPQSLGGVVVGTGPGTFTGVRITVATARALALALSIPVVGVSTLAVLAASAAAAKPEAEVIVPVVDARRSQVFYGIYTREKAAAGAEPRWARMRPFGVCDRGALGGRVLDEVAAEVGASGDAAGRSIAVVGEDIDLVPDLSPDLRFRKEEVNAEYLILGQDRLTEPGLLPEGDRLAAWLLREACVAAAPESGPPAVRGVGEPGTPESVKPIYVRSPDADIHITKMRDPWATKPTST